MSTCCVTGCYNRYSPSSSLKFYRIPCGNRPFQVNRRRLWIKAIKQANGNNFELPGYARICGAHFVSGELSMDNESPDFVPSVFPNSIKRQNQNGLRRGRSRGLRNDEIEEKLFPPEAPKAEPPVDLNPPVLMEMEISGETQSLSPSEPKEEEALTKEVVPETETKTMEVQETSIINKTLPEQPKGILRVIKMHPVVILKPLIVLNGAFHCEQCNETFISVSELVKHRQQHKEPKSSDSSEADVTKPHPAPEQEPSFPCNMCDQTFTTSRNLKRHKLLHVKDCRKCLRCGTLFCRRHNHFLFWPRPELKTSVQEDSISAEEDSLDCTFSPEKMALDKTSEMAETDEPSVLASELVPKMSETMETQPPASLTDEPSAFVPEQVPKMSETTETQPPASPTDEPSTLVPEQAPKMSETAETQPPASPTDGSLVSVPELVLNNPRQSPVIVKPALVSVQPPPAPCPPSPVLLTNTYSLIGPTSPMPKDTPDLGQSHLPQYPELPSALKIFSPQYLTSALLDVERNYEYILNRAKTVQIEHVVEEEPEEPEDLEEPVFICPVEKPVKPAKGENIAYDLEITL